MNSPALITEQPQNPFLGAEELVGGGWRERDCITHVGNSRSYRLVASLEEWHKVQLVCGSSKKPLNYCIIGASTMLCDTICLNCCLLLFDFLQDGWQIKALHTETPIALSYSLLQQKEWGHDLFQVPYFHFQLEPYGVKEFVTYGVM